MELTVDCDKIAINCDQIAINGKKDFMPKINENFFLSNSDCLSSITTRSIRELSSLLFIRDFCSNNRH